MGRYLHLAFVIAILATGCKAAGEGQTTSTPELTPTVALATQMPTLAPTLTATPVTTLTNRKPSLAEIESYLMYHSPKIASLREANIFNELWGGPRDNAGIIYRDINGDNEDDLIVSDWLYAGVMVWLGDRYSEPVQEQYYPGKYGAASQVSFQDWTNDGVPEVIFDVRSRGGGSGFLEENWHRYLIHCINTGCGIAWEHDLGTLDQDSNSGGMLLEQVDIAQETGVEGTPALEVRTIAFKIWCPTCYSELLFPTDDMRMDTVDLFVSSERRTRYQWNGAVFELLDEQSLGNSSITDDAPLLHAVSPQGTSAIVEVSASAEFPHNNDCQLLIDGQKVGDPFKCKYNFTRVEWRDITGDTSPDLVISAFAFKYCFYQQLIAFEVVGGKATQIADVTGCVVQPDLFGVRLEDVDEDSVPEIISAGEWYRDDCAPDVINCWYAIEKHNDIYKWNGDQSIFQEINLPQ